MPNCRWGGTALLEVEFGTMAAYIVAQVTGTAARDDGAVQTNGAVARMSSATASLRVHTAGWAGW